MRPRTTTRPDLSRESIVAAGLKIVRAEGLAELKMRRVAAELGSSPMALYYYVTDRQALLIGMLDEVMAAFEIPPPDEDARAEVVAICVALHDLYLRDPWIVHLRVVDNLGSVHTLAVLDRIFAALFRTGMDGNRAWIVYGALFNFIFGDVMTAYHAQGVDSVVHRIFFDEGPRYPAIQRLIAENPARPTPYSFPALLADFLDGLVD